MATRRQQAIATLRTRMVVTTTVANNGTCSFFVGLWTAAPRPGMFQIDWRHLGRRVGFRCPVEGHTRVLEAKAVLLGLIDRHAHSSRLTGFVVAPDDVLENIFPWMYLSGPAHLALEGVCCLAVRRVTQL